MRILKIALDSCYPNVQGNLAGGAHELETSRAMAKLGHFVVQIILSPNDAEMIHRISNNHLIYPLNPGRYGMFLRKGYGDPLPLLYKFHTTYLRFKTTLTNLISQYNIDVIYLRYNWFVALYLYLIVKFSKKLKRPIILETSWLFEDIYGPHKYILPLRLLSPLFFFLEKKIFESSVLIITPVDYVYERLLESYPSKKVALTPNGVNTEYFEPGQDTKEIRKKYSIKSNEHIVFYAGNYDKHRRVDYLIKAAPKIIKEIKNIKFMIVGVEGEKKETLQKLSEEYNVQNYFIFPGIVAHSKIAKYYALADVVTAPYTTKYDCPFSPLKILEGMAVGKVVVTTEHDDLKKYIVNGKTGMLIPSDDIDELSTSIVSILKNPEKRGEIEKNAREFVVRNFSWARQTGEIITEIMDSIQVKTGGQKGISTEYISVVIPVYNSSKTLAYTLNSLFSQTYPSENYEVIVVDSSPNEDASTLVRKHFLPVKYIKSEKRLSPGEARNLGVEHAKGRIIAFIDSDCVAYSNWLDEINNSFMDEGVDGVGGSVSNYRSDSLLSWVEYFIEFDEFNEFREKKEVEHIPSCNAAYKKEIFLKIGGFPNLRTSEDEYLNLRLIRSNSALTYNSKMNVSHINRTNLLHIIKNQMLLGEGFFKLRRKHRNLDGAIFSHYLFLLPFFPIAHFYYRFKHASDSKKTSLFILLSPPVLICLIAFSFGGLRVFLQGNNRSHCR